MVFSLKHMIWCFCYLYRVGKSTLGQHIFCFQVVTHAWKHAGIHSEVNLRLSGIFVSLPWVLPRISPEIRLQSWTSSPGSQAAPPDNQFHALYSLHCEQTLRETVMWPGWKIVIISFGNSSKHVTAVHHAVQQESMSHLKTFGNLQTTFTLLVDDSV